MLGDVLLQRAHEDPGRPAFAYGDDQLTFAELAERATARAGALQGMGVGVGDRVAIAMSVGLDLVEVFWAIQLVGAASCVFNPSAPAETLGRRIDLVRPRLVVTDDLAAGMYGSRTRLSDVDVGPDDLALLSPTSGTTGAARVSMLLHRNLTAGWRTSRGYQMLGRDDVFVCWLPPWYAAGLRRFVIDPVYFGASCHLVQPGAETVPEWLATISRVRGTFSSAPDFGLRLAVRMVDPATVDLSALRLLRTGGEPVRWAGIEEFERRFAVPGVIAPVYGLGEVPGLVSEHLPGEEIGVDATGNVSCGTPNPGLEVRAGDVDHPEEILVRGDAVFAGYFDAPEETSRKLRDGWLHTGDAGYLDSRGRLFVVGRREGFIKRGAGSVAPRELEDAARRVPGVGAAGATAVSAPRGDGELVAIAVEADVSPDRSAEQIAAEVSREIVAAMGFAPSHVTVLPPQTIPRTDSGKIRHTELRTLLETARG